MRNVYIVGAYIPNGGTYFAYHLGLIVGEYVGGKPIAVQVVGETPESSVFEYPRRITMASIDQFKELGKPDDILIMNPSFSDLGLGSHFNGYKLMYVQGFSTFNVIDSRFDSYVSVSGYVCEFLQDKYGIRSPVIPPFVELTTASPPRRWEERPENRLLVITKGSPSQQAGILEQIKGKITLHRPDILFDVAPARMKHKDFLAYLAGYRYVLSLSCAEGFGMVPLESMGLGAAVVAFDAGGGSTYMVNDKNCWCTSYPNVELLGDRLLYAIDNPKEALRVSRNGIQGAKMFTYERFRNSWINHLQTLNLKLT